jgi:hypothetical protein
VFLLTEVSQSNSNATEIFIPRNHKFPPTIAAKEKSHESLVLKSALAGFLKFQIQKQLYAVK